MKSKNKSSYAHGNEHKTSQPSKHEANLRKNNVLHFQIGLLVGLVVTFFVLQIALRPLPHVEPETAEIIQDEEIYVLDPIVQRDEPVKDNSQKTKKTNKVINEIVVIDDNDPEIVKREIVTPDQPTGDPNLDPGKIDYNEVDIPVGPIDFTKVELVPIFPGCEELSTNEERKDCMSEKIDRLVRKNFNASKATGYGVTGLQKIYVQFKINKQGVVSDIQVRAPHKVLEEEARRVTGLIPQMKPGRQSKQDVEVVFVKPIVFKVN